MKTLIAISLLTLSATAAAAPRFIFTVNDVCPAGYSYFGSNLCVENPFVQAPPEFVPSNQRSLYFPVESGSNQTALYLCFKAETIHTVPTPVVICSMIGSIPIDGFGGVDDLFFVSQNTNVVIGESIPLGMPGIAGSAILPQVPVSENPFNL